MNSPFSNETISIDLLPRYEEVPLAPPHPNYWKVILLNIFVFYFFIAILLIGLFVLEEGLPSYAPFIAVILYVILLAATLFIYRISFRKRGYALRERDILYKSGVVVETTTVIPLNRIQHVSLNERVFSRMFGLGSLRIHTAGGLGGDLHIHGLPIETAKQVREALVQQLIPVSSKSALPNEE